jgi:hypothetical protein
MIEKIDIIDTRVYCYNEQCELIKTLELSQFTGVDFAYLEGSKLFTFNINNPIKRVIKFTETNSLNATAEFVEYPYVDMALEQKIEFDSFIEQTNTL